MKIGFIGAGKVTRTLGRHLIVAGHTLVVSNSRGPGTLADFVADLGPGAIAEAFEIGVASIPYTKPLPKEPTIEHLMQA